MKKVRELANRPYPFQIYKDKEANDETKYVAKNPDLEGCMAQGATQKEAIENLADARYDYIEFLFRRGLPISTPSPIAYTEPDRCDYTLRLVFEL